MKPGAKSASQSRPGRWAGFLVGPGLFLLAAWFLWGPDLASFPRDEAKLIHTSLLDTTPRRIPLGDPPVIFIDGFHRSCMDCHKLFPAREFPPATLFQHEHIKMEHGLNDQCRNCHDVHDRDRLVLQSGESVPYKEVNTLCSNCHGPIFRDWERGMHGRTNDYWDGGRGTPRRLGCTECHDPHRPRLPAMEPIKPLPPPWTLRMTLPDTHEGAAAKELDPLRAALEHAEEIRARDQEEKEF
ncbi:MAG: hypothetical protein ACYTG7_11325 [Planctomycetota bacterium]|jgi:hypothetical protein